MVMVNVDQREINVVVWVVCDIFCGIVDFSVYKDYVLIMLFLKYVFDVWQDYYDSYKK